MKRQHEPPRTALWERLEDRILFDAVPDGDLTSFFAGAAEAEQSSVDARTAGDASADMHADTSGHELIFVDTAVEQLDELIAALPTDGSYELIFIDPTRGGLEQLAEVLSERSQVDAIHILSHGADGQISLGDELLDQALLGQRVNELQTIGDGLKSGGDILFYGCNLAESELGQQFVQRFSELTGADAAASDDVTGSSSLGGDWDLEYHWGVIDVQLAPLESYQGALDLEVIAAIDDADVQNLFDNQLVGVGVSTSNFSQIGSADQFGSFTNDTDGLGLSRVPLSDGVLLVTGDVTSAASPAGNTIDTEGTDGISTSSLPRLPTPIWSRCREQYFRRRRLRLHTPVDDRPRGLDLQFCL